MSTLDKMTEAAAAALWDHNEPGCSWAEIIAGSGQIAVNTREEARAAITAALAVAAEEDVEKMLGRLSEAHAWARDYTTLLVGQNGSLFTEAAALLRAQAARIAALEAGRDAERSARREVVDKFSSMSEGWSRLVAERDAACAALAEAKEKADG